MVYLLARKYKFCPRCAGRLAQKKIEGRRRSYCPKCNFVFWNNPKPCASVALKKERKILLLKRTQSPFKNCWCLPGGYIEYEETPKASIIRETKEETGLKIKLNRLIGVYRIDNDPRGVSIDIIYSGLIISGKINLTKEHSQYKFFSVNKLPKNIAYKHRQAIHDYLTKKQE